MARGKETALTTKLLASIENAGFAAWKIADPKGDFKTVPRPFDVVGNYKGKFFAIEAKYLPAYAAFGVNKLSDGQIKNLQWVEKTGGKAFVVLFVSSHGKYRLFPFKFSDLFAREKSFTKEEMLDMPFYEKYSIKWLKEAFNG